MNKYKKIVVISGATASGKTALGVELAKKINGVVINADSMQIYKGLPILSAQPNQEEVSEVEHRLYNYFNPNESNNVFRWLGLVQENIADICNSGRVPIVLGGTGMYISRLIYGIKDLPTIPKEVREEANNLYEELGHDEFLTKVTEIDEATVAKINSNDKHRLIRIYEIFKVSGKKMSDLENGENQLFYPSESFFHVNMMVDREELYKRCEERFKIMLENLDVIDEVKEFLKYNDFVFDKNSSYSIRNTLGLQEIRDYLNGIIDYKTMFENSVQDTRHYAKRQFTWFRNQFKNVNYLLNSIPNKYNIISIVDDIVKKIV